MFFFFSNIKLLKEEKRLNVINLVIISICYYFLVYGYVEFNNN